MLKDIEKETPDVYIIDYRLPGKKNGIDVAVEILNKFPSASILFVTPYDPIINQISKNPVFHNRNIVVLVKPVKLDEIGLKIMDMTSKNKALSSLVL